MANDNSIPKDVCEPDCIEDVGKLLSDAHQAFGDLSDLS
jgi:hypothetical protein